MFYDYSLCSKTSMRRLVISHVQMGLNILFGLVYLVKSYINYEHNKSKVVEKMWYYWNLILKVKINYRTVEEKW
jgi:hypothetical protein